MRKNRVLQCLVPVLTICLLYVSCRKMDTVVLPDGHKLSVKERFFNTHRSQDALENGIVNYVQRRNNRTPFVEKTVAQIGYPRWDKMIKMSKPIGTSQVKTLGKMANTGTNTSSVSDFYYVPFVRDSQAYVNAAMIIKTSATDTSVRYVCDWEYRNLRNGTSQSGNNAEKLAVFFMQFDNSIFAHTSFGVTDKTIFSRNPSNAGEITVMLNSSASNSAVKVNFVSWECVNYTVSERVCPSSSTNSKTVIPGSGEASLHIKVNAFAKPCPLVYTEKTVCWEDGEFWTGDSGDFGGGGGGGNGGGSSGGGGYGGGSNDPNPPTPKPPCNTPPAGASVSNNVVIKVNDDCDDSPGWVWTGPLTDLTIDDVKKYKDISRTIKDLEIGAGITDANFNEKVFLTDGASQTKTTSTGFKIEINKKLSNVEGLLAYTHELNNAINIGRIKKLNVDASNDKPKTPVKRTAFANGMAAIEAVGIYMQIQVAYETKNESFLTFPNDIINAFIDAENGDITIKAALTIMNNFITSGRATDEDGKPIYNGYLDHYDQIP